METVPIENSKPLYRGAQIVWYILGVVEVLLLFRFILKLLAANPNAGFSNFIYNVSYPLAAPFMNVFRNVRVESSAFEWTTLLAMVVYWLVAWGIIKVLAMSRPVSSYEAHAKLEETE